MKQHSGLKCAHSNSVSIKMTMLSTDGTFLITVISFSSKASGFSEIYFSSLKTYSRKFSLENLMSDESVILIVDFKNDDAA